MEEKDFKLDFIGIGAGKSGTTWLSEMLKQHPDIYYPEARKELNYFNYLLPQDYKTPNPEYNKGLDWYHSFFRNRKPGQICGEITPSYLSNENAAIDIYKYNKNIKIFALLRHPAERSFSEYLYSVQNGVSKYKNFEEAIQKNPKKYLDTSLYCKNLKPFFMQFPSKNIQLYFFDDLKNNNSQILEDICHFLGVAQFIPEQLKMELNTGLQPKNKAIINLIGNTKMWLHKNKSTYLLDFLEKSGLINFAKKIKSKNLVQHKEKQQMKVETRQYLCTYFKEDIMALEALTGNNLNQWKS